MLCLFILLFVSQRFLSQEVVFGKVVSEQNIKISGVLLVNIRTDEKIYTDNDGNFMIVARNGDKLRFAKQKFNIFTYTIKSEDFKSSLKIILVKSVVEIQEIELKKKLTGNLKEDTKRVESARKTKLNKEISKYIAQKTDSEILKPRIGEFVQPVGGGFFIGKIYNQADRIDLADNFLEILGKDYFIDLGLQKSEITAFVYHVMNGLDLRNALKYGHLKSSDVLKFQELAEVKIKDFKK